MNRFLSDWKDKLDEYKVFMEYFSMICLSIMSIGVSCSANEISREQKELTEKQMEIDISPDFIMTDLKNNNYIGNWLEYYKNENLIYKEGVIELNPYTDFTEELLEDYDFYDMFCDFDDWDKIEELDSKEIISEDISKEFNQRINEYSQIYTFENKGAFVKNIFARSFLLCEIYVSSIPYNPGVNFIIYDYFDQFSYKNSENSFSIYSKDINILSDAENYLKRVIEREFYGDKVMLYTTQYLFITYVNRSGERIEEYYIISGSNLEKVDKPLIENLASTNPNSSFYIPVNHILSNPSKYVNIDYNDYRDLVESGFALYDLYGDRIESIINTLKQKK